MPQKKKNNEPPIPRLWVRKGATLKEIYAKARKAFTAADLAKYCRDEPMVPFEETLAEMERINNEITAKRKTKKKKP